MSSTFDRAFDVLIGHEGAFTDDPRDRGNWTGGAVNVGELRGTKYGISAASYPSLDIRNLSLAEAKAVYYRDYWTAAHCIDLPPMVAVLVFDAAVNSGVGNAARFLQRALNVADDGKIGPITMAAAKAADPFDLAKGIQSERIALMRKLSTWPVYGGGWATRLATLPVQAAAIQFGKA